MVPRFFDIFVPPVIYDLFRDAVRESANTDFDEPYKRSDSLSLIIERVTGRMARKSYGVWTKFVMANM